MAAADLELTTTTEPKPAKSKSKHYPRTGFAYIAQLEHEYLARNKLTVCNHCVAAAATAAAAAAIKKSSSLKTCVGCRLVDYCSKDCQRKDWKRHKAMCLMVQGKGDRSGWLESAVLRASTTLEGGDGGKTEVFRRIIDAYRLRMVTDYKSRQERHGIFWRDDNQHGNEKDEKDGKEGKEKEDVELVWAKGDVLADFQRWLDLCEEPECGILPEWWLWEDRMDCLSLAIDRDRSCGSQGSKEGKKGEDEDDGSIYTIINQEDLIQRYGYDTSIRNGLGILAELVVGYDGKGRARDDQWYLQFQEFMDLHPQERLRLIQGTIDAVQQLGDSISRRVLSVDDRNDPTEGKKEKEKEKEEKTCLKDDDDDDDESNSTPA